MTSQLLTFHFGLSTALAAVRTAPTYAIVSGRVRASGCGLSLQPAQKNDTTCIARPNLDYGSGLHLQPGQKRGNRPS